MRAPIALLPEGAFAPLSAAAFGAALDPAMGPLLTELSREHPRWWANASPRRSPLSGGDSALEPALCRASPLRLCVSSQQWVHGDPRLCRRARSLRMFPKGALATLSCISVHTIRIRSSFWNFCFSLLRYFLSREREREKLGSLYLLRCTLEERRKERLFPCPLFLALCVCFFEKKVALSLLDGCSWNWPPHIPCAQMIIGTREKNMSMVWVQHIQELIVETVVG